MTQNGTDAYSLIIKTIILEMIFYDTSVTQEAVLIQCKNILTKRPSQCTSNKR